MTTSPPPRAAGQPSNADVLQLRLYAARDRLKAYLCDVDTARVHQVDLLLAAYSLANLGDVVTGGRLEPDGAISDAALKAAFDVVEGREAALLGDLIKYYRVPEEKRSRRVVVADTTVRRPRDSQPQDASLNDAWSSSLQPEAPRSTTAALSRSVAPSHPAVGGGNSDEAGIGTSGGLHLPVPFATSRAAGARERAEAAEDHTVYCVAAARPPFFKRQHALCPTCGIEALNPAELKHHIAVHHSEAPRGIPTSMARQRPLIMTSSFTEPVGKGRTYW